MCMECDIRERQLRANRLTIHFLRSRLSSKLKKNDIDNGNTQTTSTAVPHAHHTLITPPTPCLLTPLDNNKGYDSPINHCSSGVVATGVNEISSLEPSSSLSQIVTKCRSLHDKLLSGATIGTRSVRLSSDPPSDLLSTTRMDIHINDKVPTPSPINEMQIVDILQRCMEHANQLCSLFHSERESVTRLTKQYAATEKELTETKLELCSERAGIVEYSDEEDDYVECLGGALTQIVTKIDQTVKQKDPDIERAEVLVVKARKAMESKVNEYMEQSNNTRNRSLCSNIETLGRSVLYPSSFITAMHDLRLIGNDCVHNNNKRSRSQLTVILGKYQRELDSFESREKKKIRSHRHNT